MIKKNIVAVVRCSTFKEYLKILLWHYSKGHTWKCGESPLSISSIFNWFKFKSGISVSLSNNFVYEDKSFFTDGGINVSSFNDFQKTKITI